MSDLISRQAAIDAIGKTSNELYENIKKGATFPQRQWFDGMAQAQSILENLPSAQPYTDEEIQKMQDIEQAQLDKAYEMGKADALRWIPCSERLPEEDGQYLITVKYKHVNDSYEDVYAEHGEWYDGRWDMFCFGHCGEVEDIIAWMPLPKPPKER